MDISFSLNKRSSRGEVAMDNFRSRMLKKQTLKNRMQKKRMHKRSNSLKIVTNDNKKIELKDESTDMLKQNQVTTRKNVSEAMEKAMQDGDANEDPKARLKRMREAIEKAMQDADANEDSRALRKAQIKRMRDAMEKEMPKKEMPKKEMPKKEMDEKKVSFLVR